MVYRHFWLNFLFFFIAAAASRQVSAQTGALALSSGSGASGASVTLNLTFQSNGTLPAAMQWDLTYPSADLSPAGANFYTTGSAAIAVNKSVICALATPGDIRCIVSGLDSTTITSGSIATVTFQIASTTDTSAQVSLANIEACAGNANLVPIAGTGGTIIISQPAPAPGPVLSGLVCAPATLSAPGSTSCTASASGNATSSTMVAVVSGAPSLVTVPSAVNLPAGTNSVTFAANAINTVTKNTLVMINAALNGVSQNSSITVTPPGAPPALQIDGNAPEVSGVANGSVVTPVMAPTAFTGTVVTRGSGSVNFTPAQEGNGVYFPICCGGGNDAYYKFTGSTVGSIFTVNQGQVSFDLTSRYTFAQRQAHSGSKRYAFDVRDGNGTHEFYFLTQCYAGYLEVLYMAGGVEHSYLVPKGTEDALFGSGVTMQVTMTWNGSTVSLYLNNKLVKSAPYSVPTPNWSSSSIFDLGAFEYLNFGGYFSSDDVISGFTVFTSAQQNTSPI